MSCRCRWRRDLAKETFYAQSKVTSEQVRVLLKLGFPWMFICDGFCVEIRRYVSL